MKWKKENNIHSKEQHKYSTFFVPLLLHTHIYISIYHLPPSTPPLQAILFSTCFLCALKGSWGGGSFCIEILSMISQERIGEKKKGTSHSFPLSWRYIKCCTRKTVYEKVFFFVSSILYCERSQVYTFDQFT